MLRFIFATMIALMLVNSALASKEGVLPFSSFRLESAGIGSSGSVVVEGRQDDHGRIVALTISAFGKIHVAPNEKLASVAGLPSNGIRMSYEHGYAELGGRTVYVQLQMGFASFTRKEALITLTEDGKFEIGPVRLIEEPEDNLAVPEEPSRPPEPTIKSSNKTI